MGAGEQLFVDLLPDTWVGGPPGLPQDVVEKLAQRARDAEKKARQSVLLSRQRQLAPIKGRVGTHPTFTRYVFEMPELIQVAVDRQTDSATLLFDAPLQFDLVNAKAALPPTVKAITADPADDRSEVTFAFNAKVYVRSFREEMNFVLDVGASDAPAGAPGIADAATAKPGELAALTL